LVRRGLFASKGGEVMSVKKDIDQRVKDIDQRVIDFIKSKIAEGQSIEIVAPSPVMEKELKLAIGKRNLQNCEFATYDSRYIHQEEIVNVDD